VTAVEERIRPATGTATMEASTHGWRRWTCAAAIPTAVTALHATVYGQWVVDDAGLTFAYARSIATGAGPVLQPGVEPVEGYSNPAWLAILVVGRWLRLFDHGSWFGVTDLVMFPKLVGLLCCFGIFGAMFAVIATVSRHPATVTIVTGTAVAAVPSFALWTTCGLENGLFALAVVAIAAVLARAAADGNLLTVTTASGVGGLAALAALTRPDGVIYLAAFPLVAAMALTRQTLRGYVRACLVAVAAFTVPVATYVGWRILTFGDYLPNTARAKKQGLPMVADLDKPGHLLSYTGWLTALLGIAVVAVALAGRSRERQVIGAVLVPLGLAVVSFVVLRPDWMVQYRFATPVWPLAAVVVALSTCVVFRNSSTRTRAVAAVLAALAALTSLSGFRQADNDFRAAPTVGVCNIAENTGHLFNGYADILRVRNGSLLAVDGGGTSLTSRLRFVDLSGLADRRIARFWQDGDMSGLRGHIFDELRPTFIKIFAGWAERPQLALAADPRLNRDYVLIYAGRPGAGEWVRRDVLTNRHALVQARAWGRASWQAASARFDPAKPQTWWCGDTLRPTPYGAGTPAPSLITRT
jgi:hypothetical protein